MAILPKLLNEITMGKQLELFKTPPKPPKKKLTTEQIKEQQGIRDLFFSGQEMSQKIAWGLCEQMGLKKKKLVIDYCLRNWDDTAIMNLMAEKAAEGWTEEYGAYLVFQVDLFGQNIRIMEDGSCVTISFNGQHLAMVNWMDMAIDEFMIKFKKKFKEYIMQFAIRNS